MARKYMELSVTPAVQAAQGHYYGRAQRFPADTASASTPLGPDETAFIAERDSFYLATVSETGWPYIQHRGGPKGFLRVLDPHTWRSPTWAATVSSFRQATSTPGTTASRCS